MNTTLYVGLFEFEQFNYLGVNTAHWTKATHEVNVKLLSISSQMKSDNVEFWVGIIGQCKLLVQRGSYWTCEASVVFIESQVSNLGVKMLSHGKKDERDTV